MSDLDWIVLAAAGILALTLDLVWAHWSNERGLRHAVVATVVWTLVGLAFTAVVFGADGGTTATRYLTVFTLEKSLSLDNVAVFASVMTATAVPEEHRPRVLTVGLLGALALRIVLIGAGLALVDTVHAVLVVFGALLLLTGARMVMAKEDEHSDKPPFVQRHSPAWLRRHPELLGLVAVLLADVAFAGDSILAAFGVTTDAYPIVAASVFAVLGLRPLYVVLAHAMNRFRYLPRGIGLLLVAIGVELVIEPFVAIPDWVTLAVVVAILAGSIGSSLFVERGHPVPRLVRKVAVSIGGGVLLLAGVAMLVLPGPGLLAVAGGLALLATEYSWAKRPLEIAQARLEQAKSMVRRRGSTRPNGSRSPDEQPKQQ